MKRAFFLGAVALAAACSDSSGGPVAPAIPGDVSTLDTRRSDAVRVRNSNDAGPGSFRAAIEAANADDAIRRIEFENRVGVIRLKQTVEYTGVQALEIDGNRAALDGSELGADASAFAATGGGDLTVRGLAVKDAPGNGISVEIPEASMGVKKFSLIDVDIIGNGGHGVVINDQTFPEEAGNPDASPPIPPNPLGSAASVHVVVLASTFKGNGYGASDRDGLRINEGGDGNLVAVLKLVHADSNGADGIELDERGSGDVDFDIFGSQLSRNGRLNPADFDDGIDVDESLAGNLIAKVSLSSANDNFEEGFDLNENDAGDFRATMTLVEASRNREEGIDFEEDDDFAGGGDLVTRLAGIKANGNLGGDGGLKIREKGVGNLDANVAGIEASDNLTSGISVREDADGSLVSQIRLATTERNTNHGIDFDENAAGDLTAVVALSKSANNTGFGVRADQGGAGIGTLLLDRVTLSGNVAGPTGGGGVTVTTQ